MAQSSLGIFLKVPRPGRVKTRLAATLGAEAAASLYTAFLEDTVTLVSNYVGRGVHLFVDGGSAREAIGTSIDRLGASRGGRLSEHAQVEGDLGDRLDRAVRQSHDASQAPTLILGSDSPDLPIAALDAALDAADGGHDVVLGPTADGGVWCIGLRRPFPELLSNIPWSTDETGAALRARARELQLGLFEPPPWYDCDEALDLRSLHGRLARGDTEAPSTRAWLAAHSHELRAAGILERP